MKRIALGTDADHAARDPLTDEHGALTDEHDALTHDDRPRPHCDDACPDEHEHAAADQYADQHADLDAHRLPHVLWQRLVHWRDPLDQRHHACARRHRAARRDRHRPVCARGQPGSHPALGRELSLASFEIVLRQ